MEPNLIPLQDKVVVEALEEKNVSPGGVIIPDSAQEKPMKGKVVAVGPGSLSANGTLLPTTVKAGNVVIYPKWAGTEIQPKLGGKKFLIIKESEILAILEE